MSNINTVTISGNLTRDPELKHTPSGTPVCELGVAVNKRVKKDDEWVDQTSFFDVTVWAGFGELVAAKFAKGEAITVQGELEQQRWETEDGKRSKVIITARQIDGPSMYKKAGETAAPAATPGSSQGDDIPF